MAQTIIPLSLNRNYLPIGPMKAIRISIMAILVAIFLAASVDVITLQAEGQLNDLIQTPNPAGQEDEDDSSEEDTLDASSSKNQSNSLSSQQC